MKHTQRYILAYWVHQLLHEFKVQAQQAGAAGERGTYWKACLYWLASTAVATPLRAWCCREALYNVNSGCRALRVPALPLHVTPLLPGNPSCRSCCWEQSPGWPSPWTAGHTSMHAGAVSRCACSYVRGGCAGRTAAASPHVSWHCTGAPAAPQHSRTHTRCRQQI